MIAKSKLSPSMMVPDVAAIARQMTSGSQISMILSRVKLLSLSAFISLGFNNLKFFPGLLKKDFATGVKLLCELEILASNQKRHTWVLHSQMTDMAIALGNVNLLKYFFFLSERYSFRPGILTYNPELCVKFLSQFGGLPKNLIIYCPSSSLAFAQFIKESSLDFCILEGEI